MTDETESKTETIGKPENLALAEAVSIAWVLTVAVLALVGVMRRVKFDIGIELEVLPPIHAMLNSIVAVLLVFALIAIKQRNVKAHQEAIAAAMMFSAAFLLCYVAYHFTTEETKYGGEGIMRTVYFVLLISHIVLAAVSFPLILFTWIFGFTGQYRRHRKFAKIVWPMWFYVAVTGPVCYLMLRPYY